MSPARLAPVALACLALGPLALGCARAPVEDPLPLGADAASCGSCHEAHYDEWATSSHAASARSPVLLAMLPEVEEVWGAFARQTCEGCHAPEHGEDEGIGCLSCHAAVGNEAERDGLLDVDLAAPLAGPFADPVPTPAHASRQGEFLSTSGLCGTCHELTGPNLVREPTLTEHRTSPQGMAGVGCADCHMPPGEERAISNDSANVRATRSHRFVGFDPPWGAGPDEAARAARETRELLAAALTLEAERVEGGVAITVTNVGAGHSVPTGAAFLRDLFVDVEQDGVLVAGRVIVLGDQPMLGDTPVPLLTRADHVALGSLEAGASREVTVEVEGPVVVRLRGRAIRDAVLDALALTARRGEVPTHEIAEVVVAL